VAEELKWWGGSTAPCRTSEGMPIIRLLVLVASTGMTAVTVITLVTVMLGMGWVGVAVPVLAVMGLIAVGRTLWRRFGRLPGASNKEGGPEND
jgi:hypothetical protein